LGAGLSSSASVEGGFAFAMSELCGFQIPKLHLVHMAQWSEHNFVGVKCGIMDQFASLMGKNKKVLLLDCRSLEYRYFPLDLHDYAIVLCDTKVKHSLVSSEYNTRRAECEEGVRVLKQHYPAIASLRDATKDMLLTHKRELKDKVFNRCWYVVEEIERVQQAAGDLQRNDLKSFGRRMFQTHEGLSKLYEVSCPELDFLVERATEIPGVIGSRMMGGGFGGCTINLVAKDDVSSTLDRLSDSYQQKFSIPLATYIVSIKDGTGTYSLPIEKINLL
jgi:galactokinase